MKRQNLINAQFSTIHERIIEKEGYFTNWREISYSVRQNSTRILEIQKALNKLGYNIIENNIANEDLITALKDFQKRNKLTTGILDFETLQLLEID